MLKYNSKDVMKNWALLRYPAQSDYWTFRKTVSNVYQIVIFKNIQIVDVYIFIIFLMLNCQFSINLEIIYMKRFTYSFIVH